MERVQVDRMQLELREIIDAKIAEGYDIVERDPKIVMERGPRRISVELGFERIVLKHE